MTDAAEQAIRRGNRAEQILTDPLVVEAFTMLRAEYIRGIESSKPDQPELRERLYAHLTTLNSVAGHLRAVMEHGKLNKAQVNELNGKKRFLVV